MERLLGLALHALGQLVEHIRRLVDPAALLASGWKDLPQSRPEAQRAVAHRQLRRQIEPLPFQVLEQLLPRQLAFAKAVVQRQQLLAAVFERSHHDQ